MKDVTTGRPLKKRKPMTSASDWEALRGMNAAEIRAGIEDDPDAQATDEAFWKKATLVMPKPKQTITMRLDEDLLQWFRQQRGYQTRINAILRAYMDAQRHDDIRLDR